MFFGIYKVFPIILNYVKLLKVIGKASSFPLDAECSMKSSKGINGDIFIIQEVTPNLTALQNNMHTLFGFHYMGSSLGNHAAWDVIIVA